MDSLAVKRQHREDRLHAPRTAEQVPRHRLGRIDHDVFDVGAESLLDRLDLVEVARRGRSAVGVEVLHLRRVNFSIA